MTMMMAKQYPGCVMMAPGQPYGMLAAQPTASASKEEAVQGLSSA